MTTTPILMTHDDHARIRGLLEQMPAGDRRHFQDLRRELDRAQRVEASEIPRDVVTMDSTIHLQELDSGESWTFTVSFPSDADIRVNRISILSPVGTAIIGCRVGDVVDWPVPDGNVRIRIESIAFQPEAAASRSSRPMTADLGA